MNTTSGDIERQRLRVVPPLESPWLTPDEASTYVRCSIRTIYRHLDAYKKSGGRRGLKAVQRGEQGRIVIHHDDLLRWQAGRAPSTGTRRYRSAA